MTAPIASIIVIGGGVTGWAAAAAFAVRLPQVAVTVVEVPDGRPPLADLIGTATPSICDFHADTRIGEADVMRATNGVFRLGARYDGWSAAPFLHCHGEHGVTMAGAPVHHHWLRFGAEVGGFEEYSPASALAHAGTFVHPHDEDASPLARFGYGLTVDTERYARFLRDHAVKNGARAIVGAAYIRAGATMPIDAVDLPDGTVLTADLYVIANGDREFSGAAPWTDWSRWLPAFSVELSESSATPDRIPLVERTTATADGWRMTMSLRDRALSVAATFDAPGSPNITSGRRGDAWIGNTVAIGDAAVTLPPIDGIALHIVHAHIDRIIATLPGRDCDPREIADYNRQYADEADRLRDFAVLHFATTNRSEPVWRDLAATAPPDSLAHDLRLFRARGHLPVHEGESFSNDSWLSVLIGHDILPRRHDPVAEELPAAAAKQQLLNQRDAIARAVAGLPTHAAYLRRYLETAA